MQNAVIIEQRALISAFGSLEQSTGSLVNGINAFKNAPCFDVPAASAPFADSALRKLDNAFELLRDRVDLAAVRKERPLFIFAAAKGDVRALEPGCVADSALAPPLLDPQARRIARTLGIVPARILVVSNACASGTVAVSIAKIFLEHGIYTSAVVAGFDVLSRFVVTGFNSLSALSPAGARPFDADRDGLTLGDGAALSVLRYRIADKGDIIVAGSDQSNDANHRTGPSRTGDGLFAAAAGALKDAGCTFHDVGAIKCHGTATPYNDAMEAKAINRLFPDGPPPCFGVKGAIGHTSGGGSLLEILLAEDFLHRGMVPPTVNFRTPDPEDILPVTSAPTALQQSSILCLSAGFGGLNAAVLLKGQAG